MGYEKTPEHRANLSAALKGRPKSEEHKAKLREAWKKKGKIKSYERTPEHRAKLSEIKKNQSAETRRKISEANRGKKHTPEARKKISEGKKGKPWTEKQRRAAEEARPVRVKGYLFAHKAVRVAKGQAREHACVLCGKAAQDWALDHGFPSEIDSSGRRYSLDLNAYSPLCRPCHRRADARGGFQFAS